MPEHDVVTVSGEVVDIFAHRFVVKTAKGKILADIGPKAAEAADLHAGTKIKLTGEMKPSELKVRRFSLDGGAEISVDRPHHRHDADPAAALKTAKRNGFIALGEPRRKPKHFEILASGSKDALFELHVELDGTMRKSKPVAADDEKWAEEIASSQTREAK